MMRYASVFQGVSTTRGILKESENIISLSTLVSTHHEILIVCKTYIPDEAEVPSTS